MNTEQKIIQGDALVELRKMESESVDMVITSIPYWSLRDYKIDGQIGLEKYFPEFLEKILAITAEIKRVLKASGSFWLNVGDCYGGVPAGNKTVSEENIGTDGLYVRKMKQSQGEKSRLYFGDAGKTSTLTNSQLLEQCGRSGDDKCLLMQPERIALAMIDKQGWILRNKIKWAKQVLIKKENRTIGSVMPTSVRDRFNESGEELYFFVKQKKYYFDLDSVRLKNQVLGVSDFRASGFVRSAELYYNSKYREDYSPHSKQSGVRNPNGASRNKQDNVPSRNATTYVGFNERWKNKQRLSPAELKANGLPATYIGATGQDHNLLNNPSGKNLPTIWLVPIEPHNFKRELGVSVDHFAAYPKALCEIPIRAGCPKGGIVLDPFCGSGTTGIVAKKLGRNFIGIELNPDYCTLAHKRLDATPTPLL